MVWDDVNSKPVALFLDRGSAEIFMSVMSAINQQSPGGKQRYTLKEPYIREEVNVEVDL